MAKITTTKFEITVESPGGHKEFNKLFKAYRRAKKVKVKELESKTVRIKKNKKKTTLMKDNQTIKKIIIDQIKELGWEYVNPNYYFRKNSDGIFTAKVDNISQSIEIMHRGYGRNFKSVVKIDIQKSLLKFRRRRLPRRGGGYGPGVSDIVNLADPNSLKKIKKALNSILDTF